MVISKLEYYFLDFLWNGD